MKNFSEFILIEDVIVEGVTKMLVLPLTDGVNEIRLSKKEIEAGLKKGNIEIVDVGNVYQP